MTSRNSTVDLPLTHEQIIADYRAAYRSRQMSLIGRREVMSGHAKFGIFGDGKEIAQIAAARSFAKGDFRSGYYRDQTLMHALGEMQVKPFFAQLYAHPDLEAEPFSGGRMMGAHFVTRSLNPDGSWRNLVEQVNTAADMSPTASQMPRLVGLAYASRLYRELDYLQELSQFSNNGNEIAWGFIGNASCAEGMFWETVNAIGVLQSPAIISIWDDGYGISVSNKHQMLKEDIGTLLAGFQREDERPGYDLYTVKGWDYPALVDAYRSAAETAREWHIPSIVHVVEMTQPQGHSTSGSHERYKTAERLQWETDFDGISRMREWMIAEGISSAKQLDAFEAEDLEYVQAEQQAARSEFEQSVEQDRAAVAGWLDSIGQQSMYAAELAQVKSDMYKQLIPQRGKVFAAIHKALRLTRNESIPARQDLIAWRDARKPEIQQLYSSHVVSETAESPLAMPEIAPAYSENSREVRGFELLNEFFGNALARDPRVVLFGEDVGFLGGVNQTAAGLQAEFGDLRVSDTGIREVTIMGQAIGMALRGLRPIAEIQYLDYLLYALQILSDDLATLRWRTVGGQKAPVIISTRGHRLEGVWHSGSLMGSALHMLRGIHILVPRDMTRAAGFYNTLLHGDDPGIVVEVLNGYRKKERRPDNLGEFNVPLGVPEVLREGTDVTLVTYGAMCWIALEAAEALSEVGVEVEVIDAQSLSPFDLNGRIVESLKRTNRLVCADEDVPGGASAYMLRQILEVQGGYHWLDSEPRTLSGQEHRPAYGSDGDYFSKPNMEDIFDVIYDLMNESNPAKYPRFDR